MDRPDDNSTNEIEVTPEMIEVAYGALQEYALDGGHYAMTEECIESIYRAMAECRPTPRHPKSQIGE
jgi:hypothetical protein